MWLPHNIDQHNNASLGAQLTGGPGLGLGNFVFRNQNGDVYYMNALSLAERVEYADGRRLDLTYDASRRLRRVLSNRGYALVFDYGANGKLATVCGYNRTAIVVTPSLTCAASDLKVTYTYASAGALASATDPRGNVTSFTAIAIGTPQYATCITLPNSSQCELNVEYFNTYQAGMQPDQVKRVTTATGEIWNYIYNNSIAYDHQPIPPIYTSGQMVDPAGGLTVAHYKDGQLVTLNQPSGFTQYEWNGLNPTKFVFPGGNSELLAYDDRSNVTSHTRRAANASLPDITVQYDYWPSTYVGGGLAVGCTAPSQKICNKPRFTIDERGHRTDYTYSNDHGGILVETGPAVDGVRPETRYTYQQRYAWISNGVGGFLQANSPVWLLVQTSMCRTTANSAAGCAGGPADEVRTLYDYGPNSGPNNLLLRGIVEDATGLALRTCYGYDQRGNRISETRPRAGLTSCS